MLPVNHHDHNAQVRRYGRCETCAAAPHVETANPAQAIAFAHTPRPPGRPREIDEPVVKVDYRLPESLYARLQAVAQERDIPMTRLVRKAIATYLDGLAPLDKES